MTTKLRSIQNRFARVLVAAAIGLVVIAAGVVVAMAISAAVHYIGSYAALVGILAGLLIWLSVIAYTVLWGND